MADGETSASTAVDLAGDFRDSGVAEVLDQLDRELIGLKPVKQRIRETAALLIVDRALKQVTADRAQLGAVQNRLDSTISNLSTTVENANAARSRILDADFAMETASLSRNQVLQQAGTSILAQANQQPQQVLSLLQGG
jgi:flagellin-like hook-associated protein FlgL